jgi:hypothetical protein
MLWVGIQEWSNASQKQELSSSEPIIIHPASSVSVNSVGSLGPQPSNAASKEEPGESFPAFALWEMLGSQMTGRV